MAEQPEQDPNQMLAAFPDPPAFWKDFTPDNVARIAELKKEYATQQNLEVAKVTRLPDVPPELTYLNPPPEPEGGVWNSFGEPLGIDDRLQSLEDAGVPRLIPALEADGEVKHVDHAFELKRLAKSLILNYLELMGTMGCNPAQGKEKIDDIRTLCLNFHHKLNEYRPHQARESLIALMQDQLDKKRAETLTIRAVIDKTKRTIEGLNSIDVSTPSVEAGEKEVNGGATTVGNGQSQTYGNAVVDMENAFS